MTHICCGSSVLVNLCCWGFEIEISTICSSLFFSRKRKSIWPAECRRGCAYHMAKNIGCSGGWQKAAALHPSEISSVWRNLHNLPVLSFGRGNKDLLSQKSFFFPCNCFSLTPCIRFFDRRCLNLDPEQTRLYVFTRTWIINSRNGALTHITHPRVVVWPCDTFIGQLLAFFHSLSPKRWVSSDSALQLWKTSCVD